MFKVFCVKITKKIFSLDCPGLSTLESIFGNLTQINTTVTTLAEVATQDPLKSFISSLQSLISEQLNSYTKQIEEKKSYCYSSTSTQGQSSSTQTATQSSTAGSSSSSTAGSTSTATQTTTIAASVVVTETLSKVNDTQNQLASLLTNTTGLATETVTALQNLQTYLADLQSSLSSQLSSLTGRRRKRSTGTDTVMILLIF